MAVAHQFLPLESAKPPFFVGIDLGGTNVKLGIVDDLGRPIAKHNFPTDSPKGPEDGSRRMGESVLQLIDRNQLKIDDVVAVGLGSPGTMDAAKGILLEPHNLPGWFDFPIRDRVSHHCGLPVSFANDGCAAAYGEFWVGSGKDMHSLVLLTLGTGVGGGIIIDHLSIDGFHSHGAECGHIIVDSSDNARVCPCGQPGHLEGYASATAIVRKANQEISCGSESSLSRRLAQGESLTPKLLSEEAERGDEFSLEIILDAARWLGIGVVSLMHAIDPEGVILGGAMTFGGSEHPIGRKFLDRVVQEVKARAFPVLARNVKIAFAGLGGDAGYIGAAGIARQAYLKG